MRIANYDIRLISYDGDVTRVTLNNGQIILVNPATDLMTIQHKDDAIWLNIVSIDLFDSVNNPLKTFF
jgi:hypothetical protein